MQRFALLVVASFALSGCTFIGMGIGAAASKTTVVDRVRPDEAVIVTTTAGERVEGTLVTQTPEGVTLQQPGMCGAAWLARPCLETKLATDQIRTLSKHKSYVALGAAIGFAIDVTLIAAGLIAAYALKDDLGGGWSFSGPI